MNSYEKQRAWADRFNGQIVEILKENSMHILKIEIASEEDDTKRSTDMVIKVVGGDVALRVRQDNGHTRYRDLTIRTRSYNGGKTEMDKLHDGNCADWYLYCWVHPGSEKINEWMLIDIDLMRECGILDSPQIREQANRDGRTKFKSFSASELGRYGCIVSKKIF